MGLAAGVVVGVAAGLLAAPMRGTEMRSRLRERAIDGSARLQSLADSSRGWATDAMHRLTCLIEEGRQALRTSSSASSSSMSTGSAPLTASLGELAQFHSSEPMSGGSL